MSARWRSGAPVSYLCGRCSSLALGAGLPTVMVVANKSAPVLLAVAAFFAVLSAGFSDEYPAAWLRAKSVVRHPAFRIICATLVLMGASLSWSVDPALTLRGLLEAVPELTAALILAVTWPLAFKPGDERFLFAGLVLAAAIIGFERFGGMVLHETVGARTFHSDLKRSAVPLAVLFWPALSHCARNRAVLLAFGLAVAVLGGVIAAHSGASFFALVAGALAFTVARLAPAPAFAIVAFGLAVVILGSGWAGTSAKHGLADPLVSGLSSVHAAQRIRIWRAFERRVFEHPVLGHGFNTSQGVSPDLLPEDMTPELKTASLARIHPHSMFLQIWVEFGVMGIAIAIATTVFLLGRLRSLAAPRREIGLGLCITVIGIGLVSMSPWQPWWLATIAASLLWFQTARGPGIQR